MPEILNGIRVLVVDDNATNRKILQEQLTPCGVKTEETADGPEALKHLQAAAQEGFPFAVTVLDMNMPGMDGLELARTIKTLPALAGTRLVMMSSIGNRPSEAFGIDCWLTKPVKKADLLQSLTNVLSGASTWQPAREPAAQPISTTGFRPRDRRLLLAEDNISNQRVALYFLEKLGYKTDAVANGKEALEALNRIAYDVVLMDCMMPEMDGYQATMEIRHNEGVERHTPIIALTANVLEGDREKCLQAGMDDYLPKPLEMPSLAVMLERWLPIRILLAEDDLSNQKVSALLLQRMGYQVGTAVNGWQVLDALERSPYDLVLMDCHMPEMDGLEATRQLRRKEAGQTPGGRHLPIVALTASILESDKQECLAAGMDDCLEKPINAENLRRLFARWLSSPPSSSSPANSGAGSMDFPPVAGGNDVVDFAPLDLKRLNTFTRGNNQLMKRALTLYLQETQKHLERMEIAIREGKAEQLKAEAHACVGASLTYGAAGLLTPMKELERMGKEGNLEGAPDAYAQAGKEFEKIKTFLESYFARLT